MDRLGVGVVLLAGIALATGSARAGEVVYTDAGWYRVEGSAPTPQPDDDPGALTVIAGGAPAATPSPEAPANAPAMPPGFVEVLPPQPEVPPCLAERGALARRVLALHGLELSRIDVSDAQLGGLGVAPAGSPGPFSGALSVDPDLNLVSGALPIPPSAANWDSEVRERFEALTRCEAGD